MTDLLSRAGKKEWTVGKRGGFWYAVCRDRPWLSEGGLTWESMMDYVCGFYLKPEVGGRRPMRRRK